MATRIAGIEGGRDEATGVRNVTVSYHCTEEELYTFGEATFHGVPLVDRKFSTWESDSNEFGFQLDLTYEGKPEEDEFQESWSFDISFREFNLESNPELLEILNQYGGSIDQDGRLRVPVKNVEGARTDILKLGFGRASQASDEKNPIFGHDSRLVYHSIAIREYFTRRLDQAYRDVGDIFEQLPGEGPQISVLEEEGRNWIKRIPQPKTSGDGWLVTEEYWLSEPGGWTPGVEARIT